MLHAICINSDLGSLYICKNFYVSSILSYSNWGFTVQLDAKNNYSYSSIFLGKVLISDMTAPLVGLSFFFF
jgi:hypothetical protein